MELPVQLMAVGALLIGACLKAVIYAILLWVLVKLQKLNCTVFGLLLSSLAATAASFVPVVGPYIPYPVLLLCLRKVTQADIFPECVFTAVISNALMFVVNLFFISALIGNLRPDPQMVAARAPEQREVLPAENEAFSWGDAEKSGLTLRGISITSAGSTAMIKSGREFHTIAPDEIIAIHNEDKLVAIKCLEITPAGVVLELDGHERIKLDLR